jgi:hypothetical protein
VFGGLASVAALVLAWWFVTTSRPFLGTWSYGNGMGEHFGRGGEYHDYDMSSEWHGKWREIKPGVMEVSFDRYPRDVWRWHWSVSADGRRLTLFTHPPERPKVLTKEE